MFGRIQFLLFLVLLFSMAAKAAPGQWSHGHYKNSFGSRDYYLYAPTKGSDAPLPLVVMLHGCTQSAPQIAAETGLNEVAEKYGFAVLYPEQGQDDNILKCWNWFEFENQVRGNGEPSIILGAMNQVAKTVQLDQSRIYLAGFSAGAALASNMLACYSDVFAGALIASGLEFQAASSAIEAQEVMTYGSTHDIKQSGIEAAHCTTQGTAQGNTLVGQLGGLMIIHGTHDDIVHPVNSTHILQQFTQMNDILDDGLDNQSQNLRIISSQEQQVPAPGGRHYRMDFYGGNDGIHIMNVTVLGMGHAWSGAHQPGNYADPSGPDTAELMWSFFSQYGRHATSASHAKFPARITHSVPLVLN